MWKGIRDEMQDAHALLQERDMVIINIPIVPVVRRPRLEETSPFARSCVLLARTIERTGRCKSLFRSDHPVEQPRRVDEIGLYGRIWRPKQVE